MASGRTTGLVLDCGSVTTHSVEKITKKDLYGNIIIAGGSSLFSGFRDRLEQEVTTLSPHGTEVKVVEDA